jgi:hypothetical protein
MWGKYGRARQATDDSIIRRMCFACWVFTATDTCSEYVILFYFPQQQWLRERGCMLHYSALPVFFFFALVYIRLALRYLGLYSGVAKDSSLLGNSSWTTDLLNRMHHDLWNVNNYLPTETAPCRRRLEFLRLALLSGLNTFLAMCH